MSKSKYIGIKANVKISPVHSLDEKARERSEIIEAAAKNRDSRNQAYELTAMLKPHIVKIVERAFKRYADAHVGASEELKEEEWKRFRKILNGML